MAKAFPILACFLIALVSCKPKDRGVDGNAVNEQEQQSTALTLRQDDASSAILRLIPVKDGLTTKFALVECKGDEPSQLQSRMSWLQLTGAAGLLTWSGQQLELPTYVAGKMNLDGLGDRTLLDAGLCKLADRTQPYSFQDLKQTANTLAVKLETAKSWQGIRDDFLVAQFVFSALRGAMGETKGSVSGAPLLAQVVGASEFDGQLLLSRLIAQDSIFNPCSDDQGAAKGVFERVDAKREFFSCGQSSRNPEVRHMAWGGNSRTYTYRTMKTRIVSRFERRGAAMGFALLPDRQANESQKPTDSQEENLSAESLRFAIFASGESAAAVNGLQAYNAVRRTDDGSIEQLRKGNEFLGPKVPAAPVNSFSADLQKSLVDAMWDSIAP